MRGSSGVRYAFFIGRIAITIGHWVQPDAEGDEHGSRVEVQILHQTDDRPFWQFKEIVLREPIWRADLFTWDGGQPGNWDRAHHHFDWNGMEPIERLWDDQLSRDPVAWAQAQLADIDTILRTGGSADLVGTVDQREVDEAMPSIVDAIQRCMRRELSAAASRR